MKAFAIHVIHVGLQLALTYFYKEKSFAFQVQELLEKASDANVSFFFFFFVCLF